MEVIPLLPLPAVLVPGERAILQVLEKRCLPLFTEALQRETLPLLGLVYTDEKRMRSVGCSVLVRHAEQKGREQIEAVVEGHRRFKLGRILGEEPYYTAEAMDYNDQAEEIDRTLVDQTHALHQKLLEIVRGSPGNNQLSSERPPSFTLLPALGLSTDAKQELLEMNSENRRLKALLALYRQAIPAALERKERKEKIGSNGHFKLVKPTEGGE